MAQIDLFKIKLNGDSSGNGGGGECPPPSVLSSITYTENGTYTPTAGVDGYNRVTVDVAIPQFELEQKSVTITENGTQTITPTTGYDGLSEVSVTVNVANSGGNNEWLITDGVQFGYSTFSSVPNINCVNANSLYRLFYQCDNLTGVTLTNTDNITDTNGMFSGCNSIKSAPSFNSQNVKNFAEMFYQCNDLTEVFNYNLTSAENLSNMFSDCTSLENIPLFDLSNVTKLRGLFYGCTKLNISGYFDVENATDISGMFWKTPITYIPLTNTDNIINATYVSDFYKGVFGNTKLKNVTSFELKNATNTSAMFAQCKELVSIGSLSFPKSTNLSYMFYYCTLLETITNITATPTNVSYMFNSCNAIQSIPLLDFGNVTNISQFFGNNDITTLTDLGGFKDLKIDWNDTTGLYKCPNLTYQSVMNVINNLYDFRGNGDTTTTKTIKFNANSKALLSDADIAIATNKGWIIS